MTISTKKLALLFLLIVFTQLAKAQVKVGDNPTTINKGSILELESADKGVLFPRIALTNTTTWSLATGSLPVAGMVVYNTKKVADGFAGTIAYPSGSLDGTGLYYWDGTGWVATKGAAAAVSGWSLTGNAGIDPSLNFLGTIDAQPLKFRVNNQQSGFINNTTSNTFLGYQAGLNYPAIAENMTTSGRVTGSAGHINQTVAIGFKSLGANASDLRKVVAIGAYSMANANGAGPTTGSTTAVGWRTLYHSTGTSNGVTAIGSNALGSSLNPAGNTAVGTNAISELRNDAGISPLNNTVLGSENILLSGVTKFDNNIVVGQALTQIYTPDLSDRLLIGNRQNIAGTVNTKALIDGDMAARILTINNTLKVADLAGVGTRSVVADADGQLMIGASTSGWGLTGNAGIDPSLNFLGTTDAQPIKFKLNNVHSGLLSPVNSNVSFGYGALAANSYADDPVAQLMNPTVSGVPSTRRNKAVAIGFQAMAKMTNPEQNVAVGAFAMANATLATRNTAIGYRSLFNNGSGGLENTALGWNSLANTQFTGGNTAIGSGALSEQGLIGAGLDISNSVALGSVVLSQGMSKFNNNVVLGNSPFNNGTTISAAENSLIVGNGLLDRYVPTSVSNRLLIGHRTTEAPGTPTNILLDGDLVNKTLTINGNISSSASSPPNTSTLNINGSMSASIVTVTADYTVLDNDYTIIVAPAAANATINITLPASSSSNKGRIYNIMPFSTLGGTLNVNAKRFNGASYSGLFSAGGITVQSDGTDWYVIK